MQLKTIRKRVSTMKTRGKVQTVEELVRFFKRFYETGWWVRSGALFRRKIWVRGGGVLNNYKPMKKLRFYKQKKKYRTKFKQQIYNRFSGNIQESENTTYVFFFKFRNQYFQYKITKNFFSEVGATKFRTKMTNRL